MVGRSAASRCTAPTARSSPCTPIDRDALTPLPEQPNLVTDKHLRRSARTPWSRSTPASTRSLPPGPGRAAGPAAGRRRCRHIRALPSDLHGDTGVPGGQWLATHPRATAQGSWVVDQAHWDGLPDGHTRTVVVDRVEPFHSARTGTGALEPLTSLLVRRNADITVVSRPLSDYTRAALHHTHRQQHRKRGGATAVAKLRRDRRRLD